MAESLRQTGPEQVIKTPERTGEISKRKLDTMTPEQKKAVAVQIQADPNWKIALGEVKDVAGAFWDGWEKGVNGAVKGGYHVLKATGTWIGETTAEAVHGKEGGLTDKLMKDSQWIHNGLDTTGKVLGETTAKIVSTGEGAEVLQTTKDYWKGKVNQVLAMSGEERAHAVGTGLSFVATAYMGTKGLDKIGKVSTLSTEYSVGSGVVGNALNTAISGGGQIGLELAVGSRNEKINPPNKPKLGNNTAFRKERGSIGDPSAARKKENVVNTREKPLDGTDFLERKGDYKVDIATTKIGEMWEKMNAFREHFDAKHLANHPERVEVMLEISQSMTDYIAQNAEKIKVLKSEDLVRFQNDFHEFKTDFSSLINNKQIPLGTRDILNEFRREKITTAYDAIMPKTVENAPQKEISYKSSKYDNQ